MSSAGERRTVVILFAQAVGLAELPEADRVGRADALFRRLRAVVDRNGGTVDKFIGDVVMALWGAPVAHEDDAARAARAALGMVREAEAFAREAGLSIALRAGLNRGEVLFGAVAGERATAMGDPVNVAQRLMTAAESGQVLAARGVERLAKRVVEFRAVEALQLKGREQAVEAWEAVMESAGQTEVRILPERGAPLVGRDDELARLEAKVSGGAAFLVVAGDAGVGKSRLLAELRQRMRAKRPGLAVMVGRALQDVRLPLLPFGEIVRNESGIAGFAPGDVERLVAWLVETFAQALPDPVARENAAHLVARSLGYAVPASRVADIEPARVEAETEAAWRAWLAARAAGRELLVCVEDLHWADEGTLRLLAAMARDLKGVAILATTRPEGKRPEGFEDVALGEISAEAIVRLAEASFHAPVAPELAAFLRDKSGGNPYYLEELVRFLREENLASGQPVRLAVEPSRVPDGLNGLLVARLDTLDAPDREVLKAAGAIGRVFWTGLLARLAATDPGAALAAARGREMAFPQDDSMIPGDAQWIFKHALLRDAAYSLLTKKDRKRLHEAAAARLEDMAASAGRRVRALAAFHREAAGDAAAAASLWLDCAREAVTEASWAEALSGARESVRLGGGARARLATARSLLRLARFQEAFDEAGNSDGASPDVAARLLLAQAEALHSLGNFRGEVAAADRALALSPGALVAGEAENQKGLALQVLGRIEEARAAFCRAREFGGSDGSLSVHVDLSLAGLDVLAGRTAEAVASIRSVLDRARRLGNRRLHLQALDRLASAHMSRTELDEALAAHRECLELYRKSGDRAGVASTTNNIGNVLLRRGNLEEALAAQREALAIGREVGDLSRVATYLSNIVNDLSHLGRYAEALEPLEEAMALQRASGDVRGLAGSLGNLAILRANAGGDALPIFEEALALRRSINDVQGTASGLNNIGVLLLRRKEYARALAALEESLRLRRVIGDRSGTASSLANLGGLFVAEHRFAEADACLQESLALRREHNDAVGIATTTSFIGELRFEEKRFEESLVLFREAIAFHRSAGHLYGLFNSLVALSRALLELDRASEGLQIALDAVATGRALGDPPGLSGALGAQAALLERLGRADEALVLRREAVATVAQLPPAPVVAEASFHLAMLLARMGCAGDAVGAYRDCVRAALAANDAAMARKAADAGVAAARAANDAAAEQEFLNAWN